MGAEADTHIFVRLPGESLTEPFELTGWQSWKHPTLRFTVSEEAGAELGVHVTAGAGAWGSFDDWTLIRLPED